MTPAREKCADLRIGILQTGRAPDDLKTRHGDYDAMFRRLLDGRGFSFETYPVLDGVLPGHVNEADGWLITGSRHGVYEPHPWIAPLEAFLRDAYAQGVPLVGICFGHQILAQALGGRVEKFVGGWSAGVESYRFDGEPCEIPLVAWHQDQVVEKPPGAEVIATSAFCRYAGLAYGRRAMSFQAHPEFDLDFGRDLLAARADLLPQEVAQRALASLHRAPTSEPIAAMISNFFHAARC